MGRIHYQTTVLAIAFLAAAALAPAADFRPPAVPLVTHDPYFSLWSMANALTDEPTKHWTGTPHQLHSVIRIDGSAYRLMGTGVSRRFPDEQLPALRQESVAVLPTRSVYRFAGEGVRVTLTFLTPALPQDLELLSRPATYLIWDVAAADGRPHDVQLYFDAASSIVVNDATQPVDVSRFRLGEIDVLRMGSREQPVLAKRGDNLRIDWGYLYVAPAPGEGIETAAANSIEAWRSFRTSGKVPDSDLLDPPLTARFHRPVLAVSMDLGTVGASAVSRHLVLAYDDLYSIEYFHRKLRPYWRRNGATAADMIRAALTGYEELAARCARYDNELTADLRKAGGEEYAHIATLAYRQTLAAHKLAADFDGTPLYFSKENFSNGSIATVDVAYPSSPFFLLFNPALMQAMLEPVTQYASLDRWKFPFAPHDLGTYPQANGQTYGGGEASEDRQMPVEESGNMLIMTTAAAMAGGGTAFVEKYWPQFHQWAKYLEEKGLDPENQLCTDDFAGHLARNANLSIKAIMGLASYGKLCQMTGRDDEAARYRRLAQRFANEWIELADDGDHYVLAFGNPGTWSQKYNLVWDRLLGYELFPAEVARKEVAYYKKVQNEFGLPLDNRSQYTKLDWVLWTSVLARNAADFNALVSPVYRFLNETPDRSPMTDWYWTHDAKRRGFTARSVVGGVFIKMLASPALWKKWVERAE